MAGQAKGLPLQVTLLHPNSLPVAEFLQGSAAALGRNDFSVPLKILSENWVETVGDLRLVAQEGQLRTLGLPIRLCVWMEEELTKIVDKTDLPAGVIICRYSSDFDTNGVLYWIGTNGLTRAWANPAVNGLVECTASSLGSESQPATAIAGREAVRCVTKAEEGAWFCVDLLDKFVLPTHYTLRHYSSWDTECVRDWRLEASSDGSSWSVLREHKGDTSINGKGGTATFPIPLPPSPEAAVAYNRFRVRMTGPNSNGHFYLALSGFELYGALFLAKPTTAHLQAAAAYLHKLLSAAAVTPTPSPLTSPRLEDSAAVAPVASPSAAGAAPTTPAYYGDTRAARPSVSSTARTGEYVYVSDMDTNGILYAIATEGGTKPYRNPGEAGLVLVTASSLMGDSAPVWAAVGREVVRCVTQAIPESWFALDLLDKKAMVTHYTLRHYSSWDNECLRNWRFEASNDGQNWVPLRVHIMDESLNGKGSTHTWPIEDSAYSRQAYRHFRILQTGENSNKHHYLPLSGWELYGTLYKADGVTPWRWSSATAVAAESKAPASGTVVEFAYSYDFDDKGIMYFLGCNYGQSSWRNPAELKLIRVTASSLATDSQPTSAAVGREAVRCVTKPEPNSWFMFDLTPSRIMVRPTAYTLRHYSSWDMECLRNWVLQGSVDGNTWVDLSVHKEDESLNGKGSTATWTLQKQQSMWFSYFRVLQTGPNSNKHFYLPLSGFEIYGSALIPHGIAFKAPGCSSSAPTPSPVASTTAVTSPVASASSVELAWDPNACGPHILVTKPNEVRNRGSNDKWQMARVSQPFVSGRHACQIRVVNDAKTSNTWRFIVGLVPASLDVKGPKQWVGTGGSWGYIAGTGGKCHGQAQSVKYGERWGYDDVIGMVVDLDKHTVEFFRNGYSQGIAFDNVCGPVYVAVSMTGTDAAVQVLPWTQPAELSTLSGWDPTNKSVHMAIDERQPNLATNTGSNDKWQCVRSTRVFGKSGTGREAFEVELVSLPPTPNSWQVIVGVVPTSFQCGGSKQWVGAYKSWGYIGGTGGVCHDSPNSMPYGETFGQGDIIGVILDFDAKTIEFTKNGVSQGIAHRNLVGPVHAAVSMTATGAQARLRIKPQLAS